MADRNVSDSALRDVFQALVRHRRKSAWFFTTVVAATVLITLLWPKEYRSTGKLFVRLGRENATLDATATLGENPIVAVPMSRENEINSVVEILQSRALLEKVVDALGPAFVLNLDQEGSISDASTSNREAGGWVLLGQLNPTPIWTTANGPSNGWPRT